MLSELMTDEIRQEIKDFADGKIRTHVGIFNKYDWLDSYLDEHFKDDEYLSCRRNELSSSGLSGNSTERLYAYIYGIGKCECCGKRTTFKSKTVGYVKYCGECGKIMGSKHSNEKAKKIANHQIKTTKCLQCGKEFEFVYKPNNKNVRFHNPKFCSPRCRGLYVYEHTPEDERNRINEKRKATCLERYGDEHVINSQYTRDKTKERLGVERPQYLENYGEICREAYIKHHGHEFKHTEETIERIKATKIEKYGSVMVSTAKYTEYTFPSGKVVKVQGHEDLAIDKLLENHTEDDIVVGRSEIEKCCGMFEYYDSDDERYHIYYPDIYVKSENKLIEVKSPFTYRMHERVNLLKKQCVLDKGYNFEFWIIESNRYKNKKRTLKSLLIK